MLTGILYRRCANDSETATPKQLVHNGKFSDILGDDAFGHLL